MGFLESFGLRFLILIIIALVVSAVGFYKYVYFISLGYGFSVAVDWVVICLSERLRVHPTAVLPLVMPI